jgi:hypothetical protein
MAISPLAIATEGYLCNTLSIVSNGYLCTVDVVVVPPPTGETDQFIPVSFGGAGAPEYPFHEEDKRVKKITVTVKKDNRTYIETKYVKDLRVTAEDVKFELTEERSEVSIRIFFDDK